MRVSLAVYDMAGRRVRTLANGARRAGRHTAVFDAVNLPGGVYLVRLRNARRDAFAVHYTHKIDVPNAMNFLYAVPEGRYAVNIGYSSESPPKVKARLQQGNPRKLPSIDVLREYPTIEKAKAAEGAVHDALKGKGLHIRGEWFSGESIGHAGRNFKRAREAMKRTLALIVFALCLAGCGDDLSDAARAISDAEQAHADIGQVRADADRERIRQR